jgi:hypothetical protein
VGVAGRTARRAVAAALAVSAVLAPPGMRSRINAWSWFTARTRCAARFARRSSRMANIVVSSSAPASRASPGRAATLAAVDASITSFFRRPPRESSRTQDIAVVATSRTVSSQAMSQCAEVQPKPFAFSTAHRRFGN